MINDDSILTEAQGQAARRYERTHETAQTNPKADKRLMAEDAFKAARAAMTPQEAAIVDMVVLKGRSIGLLAKATGRTAEDLQALLSAALTKLADHYEGERG